MFKALLNLFCLSLVLLPAHAQVYRWVDERGVTHYGERPTQGHKAQQVQDKLANPAAAKSANSKPPSWQDQESDFQGRRIKAEQAAEAEAKKKSQEADQRRACIEARDNLVRMRASSRMYKLNEKGERVYESEQDRDAAIARYEKLIAARCR